MKLLTFLVLRILHADPLDALKNALKRRIPHHDNFVLVLDDSAVERFRIENEGSEKIRISGSTLSAIGAGIHSYLKHVGSSIGWDALGGDNFYALRNGLPRVRPYEKKTDVRLRYYFNVCTYGYSMAWWDWTRWEKEIDWSGWFFMA